MAFSGLSRFERAPAGDPRLILVLFRKQVRRPGIADTTPEFKQLGRKGNALIRFHTSGARTVLASLCVAALSLTAPAAFAQSDPARLAAARELLEVAGSAKQFDVVVPIITQQLESTFVSLKPDQADKIKEIFKAMPEKFSQRKQELLDQIAALYAEKMTAEDLNAIVAFYKSPVGAKFIQIQPELVQKSMVIGQAWGRKIGQEIDQEVRQELKQRGITF
jgi:uncharacterized protein